MKKLKYVKLFENFSIAEVEQEENNPQEKKSKNIEKYSIFGPEGMGLYIGIFKIMKYSDGSIRTEYDLIGAIAYITDPDKKEIEFDFCDGAIHFKASFNEKGIKFDKFRDWISDNQDNYWMANILGLADTSSHASSIQTSIVGFERRTLDAFSSIIKHFYPESNVSATNFDITSHGETKKAGIFGKDFSESFKFFDADEGIDYDELTQTVEQANKFAIPSSNWSEK
jgi:hypothetical protein